MRFLDLAGVQKDGSIVEHQLPLSCSFGAIAKRCSEWPPKRLLPSGPGPVRFRSVQSILLISLSFEKLIDNIWTGQDDFGRFPEAIETYLVSIPKQL